MALDSPGVTMLHSLLLSSVTPKIPIIDFCGLWQSQYSFVRPMIPIIDFSGLKHQQWHSLDTPQIPKVDFNDLGHQQGPIKDSCATQFDGVHEDFDPFSTVIDANQTPSTTQSLQIQWAALRGCS